MSYGWEANVKRPEGSNRDVFCYSMSSVYLSINVGYNLFLYYANKNVDIKFSARRVSGITFIRYVFLE